jgi:hypothetical protein
MWSENDRLLPPQQPRQYRPTAGSQSAGKIGGHHGQRAGENIRQDQIGSRPAQGAITVSRRTADLHEARHTVARGVMAGDMDSTQIDVAAERLTPQQFCRRDRQDAGPGSDIDGPAESMPPDQPLQRHQAAAGRRVLTGTERGRRVNQNADGSRRYPATVMRSVDQEAADALRRER